MRRSAGRLFAGALLAACLLPGHAVGESLAQVQGAAHAGVDVYGELTDPRLQARFEQITHELRCLVCQNESIADSNSDLARDLRRQVREMLVAGSNDAVIFKFMSDRYGEFVRFAPPLEAKTLLIWGAPFIMLALGGFIVFRITRQRARMPIDE